ncbi:hypothetical protein DVA81_18945, partial [Acinetobacter baumannii]
TAAVTAQHTNTESNFTGQMKNITRTTLPSISEPEVGEFNVAEVCCLPYRGWLHYLHNGERA